MSAIPVAAVVLVAGRTDSSLPMPRAETATVSAGVPTPSTPAPGAATSAKGPVPTPGASTPPTALTSTDQAAEPQPVNGLRNAALGRSVPTRLRIPAIRVDSGLLALGLAQDGSLEVPPTGFPAGWFTGAPTPGELGPAVIAGHVDMAGSPAVFYDLRILRPGDAIDVTRSDGSTAEFRVNKVAQFPKDKFPTDLVYGNTDHPALRLITCGGAFDRSARSYTDNLIVFADLIGERAG